LERIFIALRDEQILTKGLRVVSLDSTSVKVHSDGAGSLQKTANKPPEEAGEG
jgi:hypothetical protein